MAKLSTRHLASAAVMMIGLLVAPQIRADDENRGDQPNRYLVTNLVSDVLGPPVKTDPVLQNAWGVAFTPAASPFWVADNATGCSTLYDGQGVKQMLQVKIPLPDGSIPTAACQRVDPSKPPSPTPAAPTGLVWNPTTMPATAFLVPGTNLPASFIFDTEDGTIAAWTGGLTPSDQAVIAVNNNPAAVYKGLVFGTNKNGVFLFAANFRAGTIDVFGPAPAASADGHYLPVTPALSFSDPKIPAGYAPFGIQNIDGDLFVSYAKQDSAKHDDVAGRGHGFVDVFDTDGNLLRRFASRGALNSPWGMARASFGFGRFSGDILIGNFGDGRINAFDSEGNFLGSLNDAKGKPVTIAGLWTLTLGGGRNSSSDTLYFTAGPNDETNGLFGMITALSRISNDE